MFELRDFSVIFPSGELTVATGPTTSAETALLARNVHLMLSPLF